LEKWEERKSFFISSIIPIFHHSIVPIFSGRGRE
jgi:hypothetical protein